MMYFETSFPVRYYETDQMAVVHHSNYLRYFEIARNGMIAEAGYPIEQCEKDGVVVAVIGVECRFRHPARMGDVVTVSASIDRVPQAKLVIRQAVVNQNGEVCADGAVTLAFLDSKTFVPVRCPKPLMEMIEKHINDR